MSTINYLTLINESNPIHRPLMEFICKEIHNTYEQEKLPFCYNEDNYHDCAECGKPFHGSFPYINEPWGDNYVITCCSGYCWWSVTYDIRAAGR